MQPRRAIVLAAGTAALLLMALSLPPGCLSVSNPGGGNGLSREEPEAPDADLEHAVREMQRNAAGLASAIHALINGERRENGLRPLEWDPQLARIALSHSRDMAERGYFGHESPEGEDFADRYERYGYTKKTALEGGILVGGENLFMYNVVNSYSYDLETGEVNGYRFNSLEDLARAAVDGWMDSPGHRENVLTPFAREGIGVFVTDGGEVYITENFS